MHMKSVQFIYNNQEIDFLQSSDENVMVNATQMAKVFEKRIDHFLKSDHTKEFINALEFTPFGGNSEPLKREDIIQTKGQSGTWMHRILALKFAAWLDPKFEVWVFTTIDKIILGHYRDLREATIEKLKAEKERDRKREELLEKYPEEFSAFLELEGKLTSAQRKRMQAINASVSQLRLEIFEPEK